LGYFPIEVKGSNGAAAGVARQVVGISGGLTRPMIEGGAHGTAPATTGKRVKRVEILLFTRELADLIDAGLPIDRALSVLIEQSDSDALQAMVTKMQVDVRAGRPRSEAMRAFPREFPRPYGNTSHSCEGTGHLAGVR